MWIHWSSWRVTGLLLLSGLLDIVVNKLKVILGIAEEIITP
jgi:hypothetical protein